MLLLAVAGVIVAATVVLLVRRRPPAPAPDALDRTTQVRRVQSVSRELLSLGRPGEVVELARAYLLQHPRDTQVRPLLAEALLRSGRLDEAADVTADLRSLAPDAADVLWLEGLIARARGEGDWLDPLRRASRADDATVKHRLAYGVGLLASGRGSEADTYLRSLAEAHPDRAEVLIAAGEAALEIDDFDRAAETLGRAVRRGTAGPKTWALLAEAQKNAGQPARAVSSLKEALRQSSNPDVRAEILVQLAQALILADRRDEAARTFARAADEDPDWALPAMKAAQAYYFLGRHDLAVTYLDRAERAGAGPDTEAWRERIENARAPRTRTGNAGTLLEGPRPLADPEE